MTLHEKLEKAISLLTTEELSTDYIGKIQSTILNQIFDLLEECRDQVENIK